MSPTKVLGRDGKLTLAAIVCATAISATAETYTWVGTGSGNWSDASNWQTSGGQTGVGYPNNEADVASFPPRLSSAITVTFTEDVTVKSFSLGSASAGATVYPITFTGTGRLTLGAGTSTVSARRLLRTENIKITMNTGLTVQSYGCMEVREGSDISFNVLSATGEGALLRFLGGKATVIGSNYVRCDNGGVIEIDGGDVRAAYTTWVASSTSKGHLVLKSGTMRQRFLMTLANFIPGWDFQGGTVSVDANTNNIPIDAYKLWPPRGGVLVPDRSSIICLNPLGWNNHTLSTEADESYVSTNFTFGGTICATNSASTEFELHYVNGELGGRGTLIVPTFRIVGMQSTLDLDLDALVLGQHFYFNNNGTQLNVKNGIVFGSTGDWSMSRKNSTTGVSLSGLVTVDTADWFDKVTPRSISLANLRAGTNETDIVVKGGGLASLSFNNNKGMRLKSLTVEAGTTLTLTNADTFVLQVGRFVLRENATLNLCGGDTAVIECERSHIDPSAQINVDVPARSAATATYRVAAFGECEGAEPVLIAGGAGVATWELRTVGSTAFLAVPGRTAAVSYNNATHTEWIGAVDGYMSTPGNWSTGVAPANDTSIYNYIGGWRNTVVTNDINSNASNGGLKLRLLYLLSTSGPYIFSGYPLELAVGNNYDFSKYPTYVGNKVARTGGNFINMWKATDAHLTFTNGFNAAGYLTFGGDVRFGGTCSATQITNAPLTGSSYTMMRPDSLTVLSNGVFTISAQKMPFKNHFRLNTDPCGTIRFAAATGALLDFTPACGENLHRVDGLIDVIAPMRLAADQRFMGGGRLNVASARPASGATAKIRIGAGIMMVPSVWNTASADAPDGALRLVVESDAVLSVTNDLTYGVQSGVTASSAAEDRALEIRKGATLTVDTSDPDVGGATHAITFADPVTGEGALSVVGVGTVAFGADVSVSSLSFEGHPSIRIGSGVAVSVAGGVDLADVTLDADIVAGGWTTVMEADRIEGIPSVQAGRLVRVVPTSGGYALQIKRLAGSIISIQ